MTGGHYDSGEGVFRAPTEGKGLGEDSMILHKQMQSWWITRQLHMPRYAALLRHRIDGSVGKWPDPRL